MKVRAYGLKDLDIMQKFCTPVVCPLGLVAIPELARKLVEVEYMLKGKLAPASADR